MVAVEPSAQMRAQRRTPAVIGVAEALPFDDDSFDAAAMALVIAFVPAPAKAVAEMARVVRPDGWVAAYTWDVPAGGPPPWPRPPQASDRP